MARRELIQYIDDLDGTTLNEGEVNVIQFSFAGRDYVIDLSEKNAKKFEELLRPYIENATLDTEAGTRTRRRAAANPNAAHTRERNRKIRKWAQDKGMEVADRGALPKSIIEAYENA